MSADTIDPIQQAWENARELIRQENDIVNHRLTAWLSVQAFMFSALVYCTAGFAADTSVEYKLFMFLFMLAVTIGGFVSAWQIYPAIRAAYRHVNAVKIWWDHFLADKPVENGATYRQVCPFPPIVGKQARSLLPTLPFEKKLEDEPYNELKLDAATNESLGVNKEFGFPKLITLFVRIWSIFFVCIITFCPLAVLRDLNHGNTTVLTIKESAEPGDISISFKGKIDKLPDFERRISAIQSSGRGGKP